MRIARPVLALALLAAAVLPARAETHDPRTITLGWMTRHADAVVVGRVAEERALDADGLRREADLLVDEVIRGGIPAGTTARVVFEGAGERAPWRAGVPNLAFLRSLPADPGAPARWGLVSGSFGIRPVPESGPEARFPGVARTVAAALDGEGRVARPADLRAALLGWMEDADPGLAWSAALDFAGWEESRAGLRPEEGARVVAAFRRHPVGKESKRALALAVACSGDPGAGAALVEAVAGPGGRGIRTAAGEALRRLRDPGAAGSLIARLANATPAVREDLLVVLGALGDRRGAEAARGLVADPEPGVRVEAAHALGLLARAAREADPGDRVGGREALEALASREGAAANEIRAALWALAQLDEAAAWKALRRIAAEDPRETVRTYAADLLRAPRVSLILE